MTAGRAKTRDGRLFPGRVKMGPEKRRWVDPERVVQQKLGAEGDAIAIIVYTNSLLYLIQCTYTVVERICVCVSGEIGITDSHDC